ncbi:MAG: class I SAM-dependent methyltransferase [Betaproteobacteria bacterium]|nr:class I SAM-dependent methyltransferase [Betaproteobacteria bacterium]
MHGDEAPSSWVVRWLGTPGARQSVLDLACGRGRHARLAAERGFAATAVDRDAAALATLSEVAGVRTKIADLEGAPWPFSSASFDIIIVTNYLHRPLFEGMAQSLRPSGMLIYETFTLGNERHGRPSNPAFLLKAGELLAAFAGSLRVVAFEEGEVNAPKPAIVQRYVGVRLGALPDDWWPNPERLD